MTRSTSATGASGTPAASPRAEIPAKRAILRRGDAAPLDGAPTAWQLGVLKALAASSGRLWREASGAWAFAPLFGTVRAEGLDLDAIRAMEERGWLRRVHACIEESVDTRELTDEGRTLIRMSRCG